MNDLNYSLLYCAILCKILEIADVETPDNRANFVNAIRNPFINRSAAFERARGTLPRQFPICSSSKDIFPF